MTGAGGNGVAQDQLRAFVERIIRMREEAKAINDDIREIYAEAKANGFDKTVLGKVVLYVEKRATKAAELQEADALFDLSPRTSRALGSSPVNSCGAVSTAAARSLPGSLVSSCKI